MARNLSQMTWDDVQEEMSIAGSPEGITLLGKEIEGMISYSIDPTNRAELINVEFMLQKLLTEIRSMQRKYDKTHKIIPGK